MLRFFDGSCAAEICESCNVGFGGRPVPVKRLFVRNSSGSILFNEEFRSEESARAWLLDEFPDMVEVFS